MNRVLFVIMLAAMAAGAEASAQTPGPAPMSASASATRGKLLFLRCASCHALAEGAAGRIGPNLHGVVGRKAASLPGYAYSASLKATGLIWTEANLDRWLTQPSAVAAGTSMAFGGLARAEDRQAVIAYLKHPA